MATHVSLTPSRFGLLPFRSPLLRQSRLISFPAGTEMFHFTALAATTYVFSRGFREMNRGGFPHSDIFGSKPACDSPKLFAASHVLHRRSKPRHPPSALRSLSTHTSRRYTCNCQRSCLAVPAARRGGQEQLIARRPLTAMADR